MIRMRAAANPVRSAWALIFALMLSLRLLGSAGYMPSLDHGSLTMIACPDAELNAPLALPAMHHHGHMQHAHSICPYAAAAALGAADAGFVAFAAILLVGIALQLGRAFASLPAQRNRERPPAIGPPLPA
jgi:hypothetical protein